MLGDRRRKRNYNKNCVILLLGGMVTERKLSGALHNVSARPEKQTKAWMEIQIKPILLQHEINCIHIIMIILTP